MDAMVTTESYITEKDFCKAVVREVVQKFFLQHNIMKQVSIAIILKESKFCCLVEEWNV
jgi:hypothetical protein